MILYRPVGMKEYELIRDTGFTKYPPRLFHQPIFYPVLNEEYAIEIASKWNTKDKVSDFVGIVTKFEVRDEYITKFKIEVVGNGTHQEMWVPAEDLDEFNNNIVGEIAITKVFYGTEYKGNEIEVG